MTIERTEKDELVITLSKSIKGFRLQRVLDYMRYLEITANSKAKQAEIDKRADKVNADWWESNKHGFLK